MDLEEPGSPWSAVRRNRKAVSGSTDTTRAQAGPRYRRPIPKGSYHTHQDPSRLSASLHACRAWQTAQVLRRGLYVSPTAGEPASELRGAVPGVSLELGSSETWSPEAPMGKHFKSLLPLENCLQTQYGLILPEKMERAIVQDGL